MKTFLQNETTAQCLKNLREWTHETSEAFDFEGVTAAVDVCRDFAWRDVCIVIQKKTASEPGGAAWLRVKITLRGCSNLANARVEIRHAGKISKDNN